jgi:hypothetical protein
MQLLPISSFTKDHNHHVWVVKWTLLVQKSKHVSGKIGLCPNVAKAHNPDGPHDQFLEFANGTTAPDNIHQSQTH